MSDVISQKNSKLIRIGEIDVNIYPKNADMLEEQDKVQSSILNLPNTVGICYLPNENYFFDERRTRLSFEAAKQKLLENFDKEITSLLHSLVELDPYIKTKV